MRLYINGYIVPILEGSGGFDELGRPVKSSLMYGNPIPCMYKAQVLDKRGEHKDGRYTRRVYVVHFDSSNILNSKRARLMDASGNVLSDMTVQRVEVAKILGHTEVELE